MLEDRERMQKVPVCVDGRLAATHATGVASYAAAIREALGITGAAPLLLDDATCGRFDAPRRAGETLRRQVRARLGGVVRLHLEGTRLHARDVFRLAQARFAATGRLLELSAPGPAGIMHWTYPIAARIEGWVNFYTVHDVIPLATPALSPIDPAPLARRIMAIAAHADRIVTVSEASRRAILRALPIGADAVSNCGLAVTALEPGSGSLPAGLMADNYFLHCGLSEPRKNLPRLIDAWAASGTHRPLVLAGPGHEAIAARPGLVILPYQSRAALVDLLRHARALLFPSLAEGFGLPLAEAMTLGTPALSADRDALAETAGGAALLVDPTDTADIARGIARLDRDEPLRADLIERGRARSLAFTPQAFAGRLRRLHDEFAGDSRFAA
jgi:glycosyltransferase involved in cell wall biosynthesis